MLTALLLTLTGRLRDVPPWAWVTVLGVGLAVSSGIAVESYAQRAYARGRRDTLQQSALVRALRADTVRITTQRTDTILRTVVRQAAAVQGIAERVPDTVRVAHPVVDTLVVESIALADSVTVLRRDVLTERTAHEQLHVATSLLVVAKTDSIRVLAKRPTRTAAGLVAIALGVFGYLIGTQ
jgi:hypothetical protein